VFVVGKEPKLLSVSLAIVKDDGALPAQFLIVIEFAQMSNDMLPRPRIGANAFDEGIVGMGLTLLGSLIASQKHPRLLDANMARETTTLQGGRFPLHRQNRLSTTQSPGNVQAASLKIVENLSQVRNIG